MTSNRVFNFLLFLLAVAHLLGFAIDVIEVDSAQLAQISREMLLSGNPFQLTFLGEPYLDKPHLLFWTSALSMKIFGVGSMAYKLPSLLFAALCIFSVYRFSKLFYDEATSKLAVLIAASHQAMFIATNDVRADTILMGTVMFSLWQLAALYQSGKFKHLFYASMGVAFAMMAKGPIGFVLPIFAFIPALLISGEWRKLVSVKWIVGVTVVAIFLVPICLAHYFQFGLEGLKFYFWTQSFGRITGESSWRNNPDMFFVVHTTLWAFLPYSLFLLHGILKTGGDILNGRVVPELFSFFGLVLTLFALSRSNYQLPHYFYVAYPLGAVVAAYSFRQLLEKNNSWWKYIQYLIISLGLLLPILIIFYVFPASILIKSLFVVTAIILVTYFSVNKNVVISTVVTFAFLNICLSTVFYPQLLKYQSNSVIGKYLQQHCVVEKSITVFDSWRVYALSFHAEIIPFCTNDYDVLKQRIGNKSHFIVCKPELLSQLNGDYKTSVILEVDDFPISQLTTTFLNPNTRAKALRKVYLVEVIAQIHK